MAKNIFMISMIFILANPIFAGDYEIAEQQVPIRESNKCQCHCKIGSRHAIGLFWGMVATGITFCLVDGPMEYLAAKNDPNFDAFYNSVPQCYELHNCSIVANQDCFDLVKTYGRGMAEILIGGTTGGTLALIGTIYGITEAINKYCPRRR
jgi:hypothetical protein